MSSQTPSVSFHGRLRDLHIHGLVPVSCTAALSEGFCATRPAREKLLGCQLSKPARESDADSFQDTLSGLRVL